MKHANLYLFQPLGGHITALTVNHESRERDKEKASYICCDLTLIYNN